MDPHHIEDIGSLLSIVLGILNDWTPYPPLMIIATTLFILLPISLKNKRNGIIFLIIIGLPIISTYLLCRFLNITHFITSRYFINFFPIFLILIYLSITTIENRWNFLTKWIRIKFIFVILFVFSNLLILPLYYKGEKQDIRGLVNYLKSYLRSGDKIFDGDRILTPGILHYFGVYPEGRHYIATFKKQSNKIIEYKKSFIYKNEVFTIYWSNTCCAQYISDGGRLWIAIGKKSAKRLKENPNFVLKGYFDGSFLNWNRFPTDASIYLFLLDPNSPNEKGIDMPIE